MSHTRMEDSKGHGGLLGARLRSRFTIAIATVFPTREDGTTRDQPVQGLRLLEGHPRAIVQHELGRAAVE